MTDSSPKRCSSAPDQTIPTVDPCFARRRVMRLRRQLEEEGLDGLVIFNPADQRWLTGWRQLFDDEPAHIVLITQQSCLIHTDHRYFQAMQQANASGDWQIDAQRATPANYLAKALAGTAQPGFKLGYQPGIRLDLYRSMYAQLRRPAAGAVRLVSAKGLLSALRAVKDAEELELMRQAQAITDAAFDDLLSWISPGLSEAQIANRLEFGLREQGAADVAFKSIVASGPNAALPHARPTSRSLQRGDFVILDFGARYLDYCADMSRTLCVGSPNNEQKRIYAAVLAAQMAAKRGLRVGLTGAAAHNLALEVLSSEGLGDAFIHALGHGVGIEVHERPTLATNNKQPLVAGNVVTVEPGVYLTGQGGVRIEDCGVLLDDASAAGYQSFASSPLELISV